MTSCSNNKYINTKGIQHARSWVVVALYSEVMLILHQHDSDWAVHNPGGCTGSSMKYQPLVAHQSVVCVCVCVPACTVVIIPAHCRFYVWVMFWCMHHLTACVINSCTCILTVHSLERSPSNKIGCYDYSVLLDLPDDNMKHSFAVFHPANASIHKEGSACAIGKLYFDIFRTTSKSL